MWIIARMTFREVFNRRVFHLSLFLTFLFLLLYGTALHYSYKGPISDPLLRNMIATQLVSMGLYLSSFIVAFFTVLASVGAVAGEVESGVIQTILVKPLQRWEFLLGKYLGLALILASYAAAFFLAVLGLNLYLSKGIFTVYAISAVQGLAYYTSLPLILLAVSLWGSTFLTTLNNGILIVMLYSFSTIGGLLERVGYLAQQEALVNIGIISSLLMPVDSIYRKMLSALYTSAPGDLTIMWDNFFAGKTEPSVWMLVYTLFYVLFFLWRAVQVFTRRDI